MRQRLSRDDTRAALAAVGCPPMPYVPQASAERVGRIAQAVTPDMLEAAIANAARLTGRTVEEVRQRIDRDAGTGGCRLGA